MTPVPCQPCAEYREGTRENVTYMGIEVHVCHWKKQGTWGWDACPCGCLKREKPEDAA